MSDYDTGGVCRQGQSFLEKTGLLGRKAPVISVVGAGGKTSTIMRLKNEYVQAGRRAVVTTSTHMARPDSPAFLSRPSLREAKEILKREGWVMAGILSEHGKISPMPDEFFRELLELKIPVLIEADGARMLPLKVPERWEPVIYPETDLVIGVMGLDAVGKPFSETCFRPELAVSYLQKKSSDLIACEDLAKIGISEWGLKKGIGNEKEFWILLNKADTKDRILSGRQIQKMIKQNGHEKVYLTAGTGEKYENID